MATAEIITDNRGQQRIAVDTLLREKNLIKQVPGSKWDGELRTWTTRLSYAACVQLKAVFGKAITVSDELKAYARRGYDLTMQQRERAAAKDADLEVAYWRAGDMSPLQRVGGDFMWSAEAVLQTDDMGAGKTVQACCAMELTRAFDGPYLDGPGAHPVHEAGTFHALVIAPNSVKRNWSTHVAEWMIDTEAFVLKGSKGAREKIIKAFMEAPNAVLIVNWEQLRLHSRLAPYGGIRLTDADRTTGLLNEIVFDVIVADEAHRAKNPTSKQTRALWALKGRKRWAMTGTPIANHPGDLWSLLHFVDPAEWPSRVQYVDRYCVQAWSPWGGSDIIGINHQHGDEFYHLIDRYTIRRLKSEIMGRDIVKVPETRYVELPPKQRKAYNEFREELLLELESGSISASNPLAATTRLVQLACAPLDYDEDTERYVMIDPSPKVTELIALINDLDGEPLVVFSSSKQLVTLTAKRLEKEGIPYLLVTGDQTEDERADAVERFQSGEGRVFLATTAAASEGITLTRAKVLCFLQRAWSMVENIQAENRIHRWGQEADEVTIVNIIAEDTIDERVFDVFTTKQGRLDEVTRDSLKELM